MVFVVVASVVVIIVVAKALRPNARARTEHLTRVPVDDFVVGDLPMVCVMSGEPADGFVDFESDDSSFQTWWLLLLLLGPFGLVGIAVLFGLARRPARVGGSLPMTRAALEACNSRSSITARAWIAPLTGLALGAVILPMPVAPWTHAVGLGVLVAGLVGALAVIVLTGWAREANRVSVHLDGTRRWVEVRNVHPTFAAAVDRQVRDDHRRKPQHLDL